MINLTDHHALLHPNCEEWNLTFNAIWNVGNFFIGTGYVVPQTFLLSLLALRSLLTFGFGLLVFWSLYSICGLDIFLYNAAFFLTNGLFLCHLIHKHFPVFIPASHKEVFRKLFQPLLFSRRHYRLVIKGSTIETVRAGKPVAIENETEVGNRLRILLSGKMAVKCDEIFLHFVSPMEFVDSVEWRAREQDRPPRVFQVSIDAVHDCQVLSMPASHLDKLFSEVPSIGFVLRCLVGKDIARKLYMMNENVYRASTGSSNAAAVASGGGGYDGGGGGGGRRSIAAAGAAKLLVDFHRTNSVDAINTGCKGFVRSKNWINSSELKDANDGEHLAVLNFELDIPPPMKYLPHNVPIHTVDKATMAEAQFIAQQKKYWPAGLL